MKLKRLVLFTTCLGFLVGISPLYPETRPNVLFIMVDDLRPAIGAYGDAVAITPNMDRLAQRGRLFTHAYTQQAVCAPSRIATLTGLLPDRTRIWDIRTHVRENVPDVVTLPEYFKQHGYGAYSYGKIFHNSQHEDPQSWTMPNWGASPVWRRYAAPHNRTGSLKEDPVEKRDVVDEAYADGMIAARATEAMRHIPEPFFMAVGFHKPHLPFTAPKKYWDQYDRGAMPLPEPGWHGSDLERGPVEAPSIAFPLHGELVGYNGISENEPLTEEQVRELRHGYYACVTFVDTLVGRLLDSLEERGVADNTIVVLWGDHGFHLGENNSWAKATNFELDTRLPLIISAPGMSRAGENTDALVETIDIYPTLTDLVGLPAKQGLDGRSLAPILHDPEAEVRDHALSQFPHPWFYPRDGEPEAMGYSMRTADYRYTEWLDFETRRVIGRELYDYRKNSVAETRNVAGEKAYAGIERQMERDFARVLQGRLGEDSLEDNRSDTSGNRN